MQNTPPSGRVADFFRRNKKIFPFTDEGKVRESLANIPANGLIDHRGFPLTVRIGPTAYEHSEISIFFLISFWRIV